MSGPATKNMTKKILNIEMKPIPISQPFNPDSFSIQFIFTLNEDDGTGKKRQITFESEKPELGFFEDLNKIVFEFEGMNIQDLIPKLKNKDIYNILEYIFEKNFKYENASNQKINTWTNRMKSVKNKLNPPLKTKYSKKEETYLKKILDLISVYISTKKPLVNTNRKTVGTLPLTTNNPKTVRGIFIDHIKLY
jgi:hypothetical protein